MFTYKTNWVHIFNCKQSRPFPWPRPFQRYQTLGHANSDFSKQESAKCLTCYMWYMPYQSCAITYYFADIIPVWTHSKHFIHKCEIFLKISQKLTLAAFKFQNMWKKHFKIWFTCSTWNKVQCSQLETTSLILGKKVQLTYMQNLVVAEKQFF